MSGDELWDQFLFKLRATGTSLEEINDCTPHVLQNVLLDLGFSSIQCAKLQTLWSKRQQNRSGSPTAAELLGGSHEARLTPLSAGSLAVVPTGSNEWHDVSSRARSVLTYFDDGIDVVQVERIHDPALDKAFKHQRGLMCNTSTVAVKKWILTSADAIALMLKDHGTGNLGGWDLTSRAGLVFHSDTSASLSSGSIETIPQCRLVLCEVVLGNTKLMDEEDVLLLNHFSQEQCRRSLNDEGYDSIQVRRTDRSLADVFILFSPAQCIPRYSVTPSDVDGSAPPLRLTSTSRADGHDVIAAPSDRTAKCRDHPNKFVEFWCVNDKKLLCSHCMFLNKDRYEGKRCILVEEAVELERQSLKAWTDAADLFIKASGTTMISFDSALDKIDSEATEQIQQLRRHFEDVRQFLDETQDALEEDIRTMAKEQSRALQLSLNEVVTIVSSVEDTITDANHALRNGTDPVDILVAQQTAQQQWPCARIPSYYVPRVEADIEPLKEAIAHYVTTNVAAGSIELPEAVDPATIQEMAIRHQQ